MRAGELESHLTHELDKLYRLPQTRPLAQRINNTTNNTNATPTTPTTPSSTPTPPAPPPTTSTHDMNNTHPTVRPRHLYTGNRRIGDWQRFRVVRNSRERRQRMKRRRGGGDEEEETLTCPVCHVAEDATDDIHTHIDQCLRRVEEEGEDEDVDVEEYEWCGETRVRATQMLRAEGQLHALGTRVERGSEDEMVDVCDDEEETYGPPEYTLTDLTTPTPTPTPAENHTPTPTETHTPTPMTTSTDCSETTTTTTTTREEQSGGRRKRTRSLDTEEEEEEDTTATTSSGEEYCCTEPVAERLTHKGIPPPGQIVENNSVKEETRLAVVVDGRDEVYESAVSESAVSEEAGGGGGGGDKAVIEALRVKVRELETACNTPPPICRICLGEYSTPVVSVLCWHVHCEKCWLRCLAAKPLCPQCRVITGPSSLRRIHV
ncbi:hypothetical protein Pmani_028787 [Petrolisthes manimaculis]|uniref:RING-type domain-containing protein n=1 Tax=Petrolisthes manimaculis TaxID=1843537 RepID=A0AAE1P0Y3_9EUCA|nr:hypothetical protein Pmani_028787 [Petrolisthes manimaculis]